MIYEFLIFLISIFSGKFRFKPVPRKQRDIIVQGKIVGDIFRFEILR